MRTNCLFFALALFFRRHLLFARIERMERDLPDELKSPARRHYIAIRRSDAGPFPHFLYVEQSPHSGVRQISYKPIHPIARACPPLLFRGAVRWGDQHH